ncbi:MAG: GDSL-type esterase/lipase family protein [Oscillospiraceae bacterium]|nr:GDSL-type esterase/lipase family protein [Oscillospiraceae bacterium]
MGKNKSQIITASLVFLAVLSTILAIMFLNSADGGIPIAEIPVLPDLAETEIETQISTFLEKEMLAWKKGQTPKTTETSTAPESTEKASEQKPTEKQIQTETVSSDDLKLKKLVLLASDPPLATGPPPPTEAKTPPPPTEAPAQSAPATETESAPLPANSEAATVPSGGVADPYAYFGNIVMLGDSMTTGFDLYRKIIKYDGKDVLRDLNVIAVVSYGVNNALREISSNSIHPFFMGKQTKPEDIISQYGAKYVFICLGINDLVWQSVDGFIKSYTTLVGKIKEKSPDKTIVVMSITPVVAGSGEGSLNNTKIMEANAALSRFASDNGFPFLDYAAALRDSQNGLPRDLSSDGYCHFTIAAYNKLVEYMLTHPLG